MAEYRPIHTEVWAELDRLSNENYKLKRANSRLKNENRALRRHAEKLRKEEERKQYYRNGRKRGITRNG